MATNDLTYVPGSSYFRPSSILILIPHFCLHAAPCCILHRVLSTRLRCLFHFWLTKPLSESHWVWEKVVEKVGANTNTHRHLHKRWQGSTIYSKTHTPGCIIPHKLICWHCKIKPEKVSGGKKARRQIHSAEKSRIKHCMYQCMWVKRKHQSQLHNNYTIQQHTVRCLLRAVHENKLIVNDVQAVDVDKLWNGDKPKCLSVY